MATTNTQDIVIRKATVEDYKAVLDINQNVYEGADYIHCYYKDLVTDPDFTFYVCEVDGEVGAFEGVYLLDDNDTLMTRAARVKDKFQGQGLLRLMRKRIYEDFKDVVGEKRIRTCCTNMVRLVNSPTFLSRNKTLGVKTLKGFVFPIDFALPPPYNTSIPDVREMKLEELTTIFQNRKLRDFLFPLGFMSVISWFFDLLASNLKHINKLFPYISISSSLDSCINPGVPGTSAADDQGEKREDQELEGLMIISGHYFTPSMLVYTLDIFGKPRKNHEEEDMRNVVFHSIKHALSLLEQHDQKVTLNVGFSKEGDLELIHTVLNPLGITKDLMSDFFKKHYFFEQNFEQLLTD